jgi:helix-turn-helix protein
MGHSEKEGGAPKFLFKWRSVIASEYGPSPTARHILLTLSLHMDELGGSCFPSIRTLMKKTGLSNRAICTHLEKAEAAGWIKRSQRGKNFGKSWKGNEYQATLPPLKVVNEVQHDGGERGSLRQAKGGEPHSEGGEPDDNKVVNEVHTSTSVNSRKNSPDENTTSNPKSFDVDSLGKTEGGRKFLQVADRVSGKKAVSNERRKVTNEQKAARVALLQKQKKEILRAEA